MSRILELRPSSLALDRPSSTAGQDLVAVLADGLGELDHGGDAGAAGAGQPGVEVGRGLAGVGQPVQVAQGFLDLVGAPEHVPGGAELGEHGFLGGLEVGGVLQQCPAAVFDLVGHGVPVGLERVPAALPGTGLGVRAGLVPGPAAGGVDRVVGQLDHVERVIPTSG
jgi:hypothetical protein